MTENTQVEENVEMTGPEAAAALTPEGYEAEAPKEPAKPRETIKEPVEGDRKEPSPTSKKGKVFAAGRTEEGGSMAALVEEFGCTPSNIRQHIAQCNTNLGFGYKIVGDTFWITGEPTLTWEAQAAEKKAKSDEAAAAKAAKAAETKAKKDAEAQAEGVEATPESAEGVVETPEEDSDFLE